MNPAQSQEISALLSHYRKSSDSKISHRAHVILLHLQERDVSDIAQITFQPESTVSRWISSYKKYGVGSIFPGYYQNQNASKLTREQKQEINEYLETHPPDAGYWTLNDLKQYVSARFDIEYDSPQSYYGLLKFCNYSYKIPDTFDIRRDDEQVAHRIKEIRDQIKPCVDDPKTLVFCADESRIEWQTLLRRAWLRKGKKTVIKSRRDKKAQSFIGFLNVESGEELLYRLEWQDQEHIIPVLISLTDKYPGKQIVIIWDNARFHRGTLLRSKLGEGNVLERIRLINLPPYAPDTNPQERVWRHGKESIANDVYNRFEDLIQAFEKAVMGRKYHYKF